MHLKRRRQILGQRVKSLQTVGRGAISALILVGFCGAVPAQGIQVGYATLQSTAGGETPVATALFSFRNPQGVLISEAGVAAVAAIQRGRIFVDQQSGPTGLALANPSASDVTVDFTLRDPQGNRVGSDQSITIKARSQVAKFVDELFGNLPANFKGSLSFQVRATGKVAAVTLRQATNAHGESLLATLPVLDLDQIAPAGGQATPVIFPHLGAGGILTSQIVLINPSSAAISGTLRFFDSDGAPLILKVDGQLSSEVDFDMAGNGVFTATLTNDQIVSGYAVASVSQGVAPGGTIIFQFRDAQGRLSSEAGVGVTRATTRSRIFVDTVETQTGIALAGFGNAAENIRLILLDRFGRQLKETTKSLPAGGHFGVFVDELFPGLPPGFTGLLEIRSNQAVAPITLKLTANSRQEPILTTLPVADLTRLNSDALVVLPQIGFGSQANVCSFATRLILIARQATGTADGSLIFRTQTGQNWQVPLLGESRSTFDYQLQPGGGLQLRPGNNAQPAQIVVDPELPDSKEVQVMQGQTMALNPLVIDSEGALRDDFPFTYEVLDSTIAQVNNLGTVTGQSQGFSTLTVHTGNIVKVVTASVVGLAGGSPGFAANGAREDRAGRLYLSDSGSHTILRLEQLGGTPQVWAGIKNSPGNNDGSRLQSRFRGPSFFALDEVNNLLYVCDTSNHTIRVVRPDGVSTLAGMAGQAGSADGRGTAARFRNPGGIVLDSLQRLWVADTGNHTIRRINLQTGDVTTIAGSPGNAGSRDGNGTQARFSSPSGLAEELQRVEVVLQRQQAGLPPEPVQILVADTNNGEIRRVREDGVVTTLETPVTATGVESLSARLGVSSESRLQKPASVALDSAGNIYVSEPDNDRVRILLRNGGEARLAPSGSFIAPRGLSIGRDGRVVVADAGLTAQEVQFGSPQITSVNPSRIGVEGGVQITIRGRSFSPDTFVAIGGRLVSNFQVADTQTLRFTPQGPLPSGLTTISVRNRGGLAQSSLLVEAVPVADLATGEITTVAGGSSFVGDGGPAATARIFLPLQAIVDFNGNLYLADTINQRIRRVDARTGVITTIAGTGRGDFSGDGGPAIAASLNLPEGLALERGGDLFISDSGNSRIRRLNLASGIVDTVAGGGSSFEDDVAALDAALVSPARIAVDDEGNLFFSDTDGLLLTSSHRVRCINFSGNPANSSSCPAAPGRVTTIAGTGEGGFSGDGGDAAQARLDTPLGLALDPEGRLIIADYGNNRIRRIDLDTGLITTIAGTGQAGFSGDNGPAGSARLNGPVDVTADSEGNIWLVDIENNRIRRIAAGTGVIKTVAGNGASSFGGDGGLAINASLNEPTSISVDGSGLAFIVDSANNRVRQIDLQGRINTIIGLGVTAAPGDGGDATSASLGYPAATLEDRNGNLIISDQLNNRIRQVNSNGIITTIAGNGEFAYAGDGGAAQQASLFLPTGLAETPDGDLIIADTANGRVRRIDAANGKISTVVESPPVQPANSNAPAQEIQGEAETTSFEPSALVSDSLGNLYIADTGNNQVWRWDSRTDQVSLVAGTGQDPSEFLLDPNFDIGDGGAASEAALAGPSGVALDPQGFLFIADRFNNRIRQVNLRTGSITSVVYGCTLSQILLGQCSAAIAQRQGHCGQALLFPQGLASDQAGNLYYSDFGGVCAINRSNQVTILHLAGNDCVFDGCTLGDGGSGQQASLFAPSHLAITRNRDLVIADSANGRIRLIRNVAMADKISGGASVLYSEDVEGPLDEWSTTASPGSPAWVFTSDEFHSHQFSFFAESANLSDQRLSLVTPIHIPANALSAEVTFWHHFSFESGYDGAVVEFSTNGGSNWSDVGAVSFYSGAGLATYNGTLDNSSGNILGGRPAFTGESNGFVFSRIDFSGLLGEDVLIRFRTGTDESVNIRGWNIDDIQMLVVMPAN